MKRTLDKFYKALFSAFGPQHWWPGNSRLEIMVGAILTQNTNWNNVEKAIANLKKEKALSIKALASLPLPKLARLIRPAGYYNIKARRLKNFINFVLKEYNGNLSKMGRTPLALLRKRLLSVNGIGNETADSILLYAFDKPIFVVDAYTKRILYRHGLIKAESVYEDIQHLFMRFLKKDAMLFNEYHALIVRVGKEFCRSKPLCSRCPLKFHL